MAVGAGRRMLWRCYLLWSCKPGQGGGRGMEIYCKTIAPRGGEGACRGMFWRTGARWADRCQPVTNHLEGLIMLRSLDWGPTSDIILSFLWGQSLAISFRRWTRSWTGVRMAVPISSPWGLGLAWMNYRFYLSALLPVPAQSHLQLSPGCVAHSLWRTQWNLAQVTISRDCFAKTCQSCGSHRLT